jgi:hypothetical protein
MITCRNSAKVLVNDVLVPRPTLPAALIQLGPPSQDTPPSSAGSSAGTAAFPEAQGAQGSAADYAAAAAAAAHAPAAAAAAAAGGAGQLALSAAEIQGLHEGLAGAVGGNNASEAQQLALQDPSGKLSKLALAFAAAAGQARPAQAPVTELSPLGNGEVRMQLVPRQQSAAAAAAAAPVLSLQAQSSSNGGASDARVSAVLSSLRAGREAALVSASPGSEEPFAAWQPPQQQGRHRRRALGEGAPSRGVPSPALAQPPQQDGGAVSAYSTTFTPEQARP